MGTARRGLGKQSFSVCGGADGAGFEAGAVGRAGHSDGDEFMEVRGLAGADLHAGPVFYAGQVFGEEVRRHVLGRVCGDVSDCVRGLQLLSISIGGVLAEAVCEYAGIAAVCI